MKELRKKVAIITGGSRGIGKACVLSFVERGAKVVFTYKKSTKEANNFVKEIKALRGEALALKADVREYNTAQEVVKKTLAKFKKIDILINNAGILRDKALFMMTAEEWEEVIATNLGGTFNMTRAVITTFMKQKKGCIINMSSISGLVGRGRQTNYSASKAGIIGFSKALAKEVASYNIRVNVVCPGFINTEMIDTLPKEKKDNLDTLIPLRRIGEPEDVANLCVFLASDRASYITGEVIKIDGGLAI